MKPGADQNEIVASRTPDHAFVFYVFPTSNNIREYTDTSGFEDGKMILFTNEGLESNTSLLSQSKKEQEGIYKGFPAMASIKIIEREVISSATISTPVYRAVFNTKSIKWKYYFVSSLSTSDITIKTKNEQLSFNKLKTEETTSDQIVNALELNFPNHQIFAFESNNTIPYSDTPIKDIRLIQGDTIFIKHLPNPQTEDEGVQIIRI